VRHIFRMAGPSNFKLGIRIEVDDPHQPHSPQVPWPPQSKVKVTRSCDQSELFWPNAVPVSLEAGRGIPCRPNSAATLLVFDRLRKMSVLEICPFNLPLLSWYTWTWRCWCHHRGGYVVYCSIMLDKRYRTESMKLGMKFNYPVSNRYHTLLRQRHIQVGLYQHFCLVNIFMTYWSNWVTIYWLRWHYHVRDIAGAPYKIKQNKNKQKWRAPTVSSRGQTTVILCSTITIA